MESWRCEGNRDLIIHWCAYKLLDIFFKVNFEGSKILDGKTKLYD